MATTDRPEYFAIPDPLDPAKASFWYLPDGARAVSPWPPRRSRWGRLLKKDIPHDKKTEPEAYRQFVRQHFAKVAAARIQADTLIARDPDAAAARFAALAVRCCFCGRELTDDRSRVYGVGPDCRAGAPAGLVDAIAEQVRALAANA